MVLVESPERRRFVIIGAGPAGLGAASRLSALGMDDFLLFEQEDHVGGLASSVKDEKGFTWDLGGHVQFSHYEYFDRLMDDLLGEEWLHHEREAWVWMRERFIPYPLQNNIRHLPRDELLDCLLGLIRLHTGGGGGRHGVANFEDWTRANYGDGIAKCFMLPYNFKVWAYPPRELASGWVGDRVAPVDLERVVTNIITGRDDISWGPNNTFRFPLKGGTGEIWRRLAARLPAGCLHLGKRVARVDTRRRRVHFSDGGSEDYDVLISTMPLDLLVGSADIEELKPAAQRLRHSTVHVVGIGLKGAPPAHLSSKCWMYFPEDNTPFYRATVFSNYSPNNVPDSGAYWSLMLEVSESPVKPVAREGLPESVIDGLLAARLIDSPGDIVDVWHHVCHHGYPTPSLDRDEVLAKVFPALEARDIYSRGRFGGWKYEVSNQDHALMQGVEIVDRLVKNEAEITILEPHRVNRPR